MTLFLNSFIRGSDSGLVPTLFRGDEDKFNLT